MSVEGNVGILVGVIGLVFSSHYIWKKNAPWRRLSWRRIGKALYAVRDGMGKEGFSPTIIVGIGRGGAVCGALLSGLLKNRPLIVIDRMYTWVEGDRYDSLICHTQLPKVLIKRVLLIAGEVHTGKTMSMYKEYFKSLGAGDIRMAAPYVQTGRAIRVHYFGIESERDLKLPWMLEADYSRESRSVEEARKGRAAVSELRKIEESDSGRKIYCIRHGQAAYNADGDRFCGVSDSKLTEQGVLQAKAVGVWLLSHPLTTIIASPLQRAQETGRILSKITGAPLLIDSRLREMDFGVWEGKSKSELHHDAPDAMAAWIADPVKNVPQNAEPPQKVLTRMQDFLRAHELDTMGDIAIVTSSTCLRLLLASIAGKDISTYRNFIIENASISTLEQNVDGGVSILDTNFTNHLK